MRQIRRYWLLWLPFVILFLGLLCYRPLLAVEKFVADYILYCPFYELTGLYCPGCGGTRSITALLHGHPLLALHENPAAPALCVLLLLVWTEQAAKQLGRKIRLIPRSMAFWTVCAVCLVVWDVLRNCIPAWMPAAV